VMDWPSQCHAILGRPAFAKFMVVLTMHTWHSKF
jgi:hypothetical protein